MSGSKRFASEKTPPLLVFASELYDPDACIREHDAFLIILR
jgi:hypothetical protein